MTAQEFADLLGDDAHHLVLHLNDGVLTTFVDGKAVESVVWPVQNKEDR